MVVRIVLVITMTPIFIYRFACYVLLLLLLFLRLMSAFPSIKVGLELALHGVENIHESFIRIAKLGALGRGSNFGSSRNISWELGMNHLAVNDIIA